MDIKQIRIGNNIYDIRDTASASTSGSTNNATKLYITGAPSQNTSSITYSNTNCYIDASGAIYSNGNKVLTTQDSGGFSTTDTKNTAGATNLTSTKLFLVGAAQQGTDSQTYINTGCYVGIDNCLYTNGSKATTATDVTNAINIALYGNQTKPSGAYVITSENIGNAIVYKSVGYAVSRINSSSNLIIPGTDPVYVVTVSSNISSVSLQTNPTYGHSCHVFFKSANSSSYTVTIANDNTNRICPKGSTGLVLTVPASGAGYAEVDFLNTGNSTIGDEVYVRGV